MRYQSEIEAIILHVALIHFTELFLWNSFILLKDCKELSIWRYSASERDRQPIVLGTQRMIATRMCSAPEVLATPTKMNQGGHVTNGAYNHYSFPPDPDHIFNSWIIVLYSDGTFTLRTFTFDNQNPADPYPPPELWSYAITYLPVPNYKNQFSDSQDIHFNPYLDRIRYWIQTFEDSCWRWMSNVNVTL